MQHVRETEPTAVVGLAVGVAQPVEEPEALEEKAVAAVGAERPIHLGVAAVGAVAKARMAVREAWALAAAAGVRVVAEDAAEMD
jgi:hypothetical protein